MKYGDKDQILQLTGGGLDIFRAYLPNVTGGKNFRSPFYDDKKASCTIYQDHSGVWRYKDFGNGGSGGDAFWFVGQLFGYNLSSQFPKILAQIVQDLNLPLDITTQDSLAKAPVRTQVLPFSDQPISQPSMTDKYSVQSQPFTETDLEFWSKYGINQDTLERYGVSSLASFSSYNRKGKPYQLHYNSTEPMYCYQLGDSVKIYRPHSKVRFLNAGVRSRDYLFGYAQLPTKGEYVLLTGGEKDVLSLASHGFSAFCLNSEASHLPQTLLQGLSDRFDAVGVLYDMDETGIRQSQKIIEDNPDAPNLFRIDLPLSGSKSEKDVSDYFFQGGTATALQDIIMRTIKQQDNSMDNLENFIDPKLSGDEIYNLHLTGVQESYYDNGQLCSRIHFKRGKKDGLYESWYLNGQQCERANYKRGKLDGVHLGWHSNGKVHELCNYKNGLLHGEYFKYDESGKLQVHTHCYKGYENLSAWKDSLTNKSVSPFKGEYEIWDDSLSPQPMAVFYMDKVSALEHQDQDLNDLSAQRIDPHVSENDIRPRQLNVIHGAYYDNGQLKERAISKAGKLDGLCERWHENGQLKERATYKAGKREGVCEEWRENGQLRSRREYSAGKREGVSETWYPNGRQQTRWNYKDDKLDGLCELWDSGGSLLTQTHYKDNKKNGLHLDYDPDSGKIYHWILFENDLSVKSGKPEELEQLEAYKNQAPKIVVPSSPVQEQAQAILDARGGDVKSTQKQEREAQVNKNSLKI
ncbi:MAG: hypothetical protein SOW36_08215 [Porphyromonas sp.]|uniref:hypothetical protein n=1 Tax=Porphyromonas sp. TaxID=1924944 RepID=UPI002A75B6A1|nr:hypothetical protein [Porphyromonas sp.]MDY3112605.1 hypothetical protein [Porphyromonas sp.]